MKKGHIELIKKMNRDLVLETIRNEQPISRAKVSRKLGISRSTVSSIVDELIEKKFVIELGYAESTKEGGRRAIQLGFNPSSGFGIGIEISSSRLYICLADLDGNVIYKTTFSPTNQLHVIREAIHKCIDLSPVSIQQIIAIGFCIPGTADSERGIVHSPELQWENIEFIPYMKQHFSMPMFINNNVNCMALGEKWLGKARNMDDFIYIFIEKGIGSAIMANGELIQGKDFMAGEIGYFAFHSDIKRQEITQLGDFGSFDKSASLLAFDRHAVNFYEIIKKREDAEANERELVDNFIQTLSLGIANMISLLNPEKVIIGGKMGTELGRILPAITGEVKNITPLRCTIELSSENEDIGVLGIILYSFGQVRDWL
ncbi:ROK family transcriptional regulator [Neobacillus kokaensis]|uniref:Xylose repressor n=1 Tax=Neobacillus kokaensis TaxID=2759023 RepID=A0ABQ3N2Q1_9BACI|nr:ROK family transcriptional regulator [Neobacillus kokaensis]GHH97788.1 xylose repressor [Neobacillus kokaensis]